jgi:hypothetical protein
MFGFFEAHDKEKEKMRNIKYMIAFARSARTSPSRPHWFLCAPKSLPETLDQLLTVEKARRSAK